MTQGGMTMYKYVCIAVSGDSLASHDNSLDHLNGSFFSCECVHFCRVGWSPKLSSQFDDDDHDQV